LSSATCAPLRSCALAASAFASRRGRVSASSWPMGESTTGTPVVSMRTSCLELLTDQVVVEAATLHQLLVRAALEQAPLLQDDDHVGVADRAEPVGDHERCSLPQQLVEVLLHRPLGR